MVQGKGIFAIQQRKENVAAVVRVLKNVRARGEVETEYNFTVANLGNLLGVTNKKMDEYLQNLEARNLIIVDKEKNLITILRGLDDV